MDRRGPAARAGAEPPDPRHVVGRPLLERLLFPTPGPGATLVAAPAGWGKSLLATSWCRWGAGGRTPAWVPLGSEHDDVRAFWTALVRALAPAAGPDAGAALRRALDGARPDEPAEVAAEVAAAVEHAGRPVVLVLDDLHRVTAPAVHDGLVRLVERSPRALSLLVLTRHDPPWPLFRLRLAGLLTEIGTRELAFGADETAELFARLGVPLARPQLAGLVERAEGWPAALRLAARRLQAGQDPDAVVATFPGDDAAMARYLDSEVLAGLSPELVGFLAAVSVADPVCAGLADAVTGRRDGERLLADLAAAHLLTPAVRPGRWYHLHPIVGDAVRSRLVDRRQRRDLHRRAAEWFRRTDRPLDAVRAAVAGRIWPLAADLIGRHPAACLPDGHAERLHDVVRALPPPVLAAHPELACALAGARLARGDRGEVAELLSGARAGLGGLRRARADRCGVVVALLTAALARSRADGDAVARAVRGVPGAPLTLTRLGIAEAALVTAVVDDLLGTTALLRGRRRRAEHHLHAALSAGPGVPAPVQLDAAGHLSLLLAERGELVAARRGALHVVARAGAAGLDRVPQVAAAHLALARTALDRLDLDEVDEWLGRVEEIRVHAPERHVHAVVALVRAARRDAAARPEQALRGLRAAAPVACPRTLPRALRERWSTTEAGLLARLGDARPARALLAGLPEQASPQALVASAGVLLELGDVSAATALRRAVRPADDPRGRTEVALLDVALAVAAGDERAALERVESALVAAAPFTLRRPFRPAGVDHLRALLARRWEQGSAVPHFLTDLLERAGVARAAIDRPRGRADPLSERQHTVLRLLAGTLSNAEIAAELSVSVNTVKTHERALYRKLAVAGRRAAVARARTLGLL